MRHFAALALVALLPSASLAQSGTVEGTDGTNSIGYLSCAAKDGMALSECGFEVLHKEDGSFSLRVLLPGGQVRYLYGENGKITSTDSTGSLASKRLSSKTMVHIRPEERFEIPNKILD